MHPGLKAQGKTGMTSHKKAQFKEFGFYMIRDMV